METNQIPIYAHILFVFGTGVALAVALDNIAIGIGVAAVFLQALVMKRNMAIEISGEHND